MEIIELTTENNFGYKDFFRQGLQEYADFFRISVQDELKESFPTKNTLDSFTLGAITDQEKLIGVVSFQREGENREKLRHKGLLFRMYVSAEASGQGVGKKLIETLLQKVKILPDIEQINLTVVANNEKAKALYTKFGFKSFALEENAIKYQNQYFAEEQMVLKLK